MTSTLCLCSAHIASWTASRRLQRGSKRLSASFLPPLKPLVDPGSNSERSTFLPGSTRYLFISSPWICQPRVVFSISLPAGYHGDPPEAGDEGGNAFRAKGP